MRILLLILFFTPVYSYSQSSAQWVQRADFANFGRHRGTAVGIGNKAYCGLGHLNGTGVDSWYPDWWEYDPGTNSWTQKSDYPGNNGNGDESVIAIGMDDAGYIGLGSLDGNKFYKYEPATNQWTQVSSPPASADFSHTSPFRIGDKGYFPTLFSTAFYEYDPANDTWTQLNNLPFSTIYGIPTFSVNGKGYIKNGAAFFEYDPASDSWSAKASFPGAYPNRPKGISQNGYGFFIGGFQGNPMLLPWEWCREVWRYDPSTDSWLQFPDFPGTERRWAVIMNVNDHVYYGLGTNGTNFNDFWEFYSTADLDGPTEQAFDVYPCPAKEFVHITAKDHNVFGIELFDRQGCCVSRSTTVSGEILIQRDDLPSGNYSFRILHKGKTLHSGYIVFL